MRLAHGSIEEGCCCVFITQGLLDCDLGCLLIDARNSLLQAGYTLADVLIFEQVQGIQRSARKPDLAFGQV